MPRSFPLDEETMLEVNPEGMTGAFGLSCALGRHRIPAPIEAAYEYPEWVDVLAKMRGMSFAGVLYRFPVLRQSCGCRLCVDPSPDDGRGTLAMLRVRLCVGHPWSDHEGKPFEVIELGRLVDRTHRGPEAHGRRRQS